MHCLLSFRSNGQAIESFGASFGFGFNNCEYCGFETLLMAHMPFGCTQTSGTPAVADFASAGSKDIGGFSLAMG
jgi:hypothetical protein